MKGDLSVKQGDSTIFVPLKRWSPEREMKLSTLNRNTPPYLYPQKRSSSVPLFWIKKCARVT